MRETVSSIGFAFGTRLEATAGFEGQSPSEVADINESIGEGSVLERTQALFKAQIPGFKTRLSRQSGILHIAIPKESFTEAISSTLDAGETVSSAEYGEYLMQTLVSLLNRSEEETSFRMDIVYNVSKNPAELQNQAPQSVQGAVRSVTKIARDIEKIGLPTELYSIGLSEGDPEIIDLYFKQHLPYRVTADAEAPG